MKKKETLQHWRALKPNQPILPHMHPIAYKSRGSSYGACGIRIDGNPAFVDAVLSRLQDLLAGENHVTRLGLARTKVDGRGLGKSFDKADCDAEVCYIRLHQRGGDAVMVGAMFDRSLDGATEAYFADCDGQTTRDALLDGQAQRVAAFEDACESA